MHWNFLAWLTFQPWRWKCHVPLNHGLTFTGLQCIMSQKIELFITTSVRTLHDDCSENLRSTCTKNDCLMLCGACNFVDRTKVLELLHPPSSTLKSEAAGSFKMWMYIYQTTRRNSKVSNLQQKCFLKFTLFSDLMACLYTFWPWNVGSTFLLNIDKHLLDCTLSYPRRLSSL
jgi:hypothetical protein